MTQPARVLIAGSGAREHALAWSILRDHPDAELHCTPGNAGTAAIGRNLAVAADDAGAIAHAARECDAELVVIGPDAALASGVADACIAAGIAVFGPTAAAARVESSKRFAKQLMDSAGIPTAHWCSGGRSDRATLLAFVDELRGSCVVKADGLALGKGVLVCDTRDQARAAIAACLDEQRFGSAGNQVLIEERLYGPEITVLALTDARSLRILPPSHDYKRVGDGDTGPNTGGMGAITPPPGVDDALLDTVERLVLRPCIDAIAAAGAPFAGCLYAQLMLTADGPRVVEFNARFGDPEAQVVLPVVDEDVLGLLTDCARGTLKAGRARRTAAACATGVVLAAAGYPGTTRRGDVISGLNNLDRGVHTSDGDGDARSDDVLVFHAGTRCDQDGNPRTDGGRVLTLVARADTLEHARQRAYSAVPTVHFDGMQYRRDIGSELGPGAELPDRVERHNGAAQNIGQQQVEAG